MFDTVTGQSFCGQSSIVMKFMGDKLIDTADNFLINSDFNLLSRVFQLGTMR